MTGIPSLFNRTLVAKAVTRLFSGNQTADEAQWLKSRQEADTTFDTQLDQTCRALANIQALEDDLDMKRWVDEASATSFFGENTTRRSYRFVSATAAVLLAAIAFYFSGLYQQDASVETNIQRYITRVGEQKTIDLNDGSIITLNTGTQLLVSMKDNSRSVVLERGEAFFQVAKDSTRPFSVAIGEHAVSVLGTQFNLRRSPSRFTLAVTEGMVSVHSINESVSNTAPLLDDAPDSEISISYPGQRRVKAGWIAEYDTSRNLLMAKRSAEINSVASWRSGLLHFANEPLVKVIQELNRYSGKKILIEDADIMNIPISGSLRTDRLNSTLSGLERSQPIRVVHNFDHVVITGKH